MVDAEPDPAYEEKKGVTPAPLGQATTLCHKYMLLQRSSVYAVCQAGWLATEKQADRHLYFGAYCSTNTGQLSRSGGVVL